MIPVCFKHFPQWNRTLLVSLHTAAMMEVEIEAQGNGCGRAGWEGKAVPDTLYGLSVRNICNVHDVECDYVWSLALSKIERKQMIPAEADEWLDRAEVCVDGMFGQNLKAVVHLESSNWVIRYLRQKRANKYYGAVLAVDVLSVLKVASLDDVPRIGAKEVAVC